MVVTVPWSGEQRGFFIEVFPKNAGCVTATQRVFRTRFGLNSNERWNLHIFVTGLLKTLEQRHWCIYNGLHSVKVAIWCALSSVCIVVPYFFEVASLLLWFPTGSDRCWKTFYTQKCENMKILTVSTVLWFQQDGATAHTAHNSRAILQEMFYGRLISLTRRHGVARPSRSPDWVPATFFYDVTSKLKFLNVVLKPSRN